MTPIALASEASILYSKNAKVWIAARSRDKAEKAMQDIRDAPRTSRGRLVFLPFDLCDLNKVKEAGQVLTAQESRLDTTQGYERSIGVKCIATTLFTKLLTPLLVVTVKVAPPNSDVGVDLTNLDFRMSVSNTDRYGISKAGAWALGVEYARRHKVDGIVSLPINTGNLTTELSRRQTGTLKRIMHFVCYEMPLGLCTALFAAFSPDITMDQSGDWVAQFGRFYLPRKDLIKATKLESEGGTGGAYKFWEWNEEQVKPNL
ncbi:putative estradiol 17 beta-dehydrogenase [Coniochaeta sp. 2T2.1]|nr:putative estradiol 17 beta-dehydrogenase [Coniochaeta sp. 2T2.1]